MEVTGGGLGGDANGGPKGRVLEGCPPGVTKALHIEPYG